MKYVLWRPCGGWRYQMRVADVQSFHCRSCGWELWSHGHRYLKGQQPSNTLVVREAVRLKEAFRDVLSQGTPEAVARYPQARRTAASAVTEAKQQVWEEFGEAMEKDFQHQSVSGKPFDTLGGGNGEPSKLYIVRMGHCWPQLRRWSDGGKNTLRNSWTWLSHPQL